MTTIADIPSPEMLLAQQIAWELEDALNVIAYTEHGNRSYVRKMQRYFKKEYGEIFNTYEMPSGKREPMKYNGFLVTFVSDCWLKLDLAYKSFLYDLIDQKERQKSCEDIQRRAENILYEYVIAPDYEDPFVQAYLCEL